MSKIDELVTQLTGRDFHIIQMPALAVDRAEAVKAIFQLEVQTVNTMAARLKADVASLMPFRWDSQEDKARKLDLVRSDESERRTTWHDATEESRPSHSMSSADESGHDSRVHMNDNNALRQAVHIDLTKSWGSS